MRELTLEELKSRFSGGDVTDNLLKLVSIVELLRYCVLDENYRISDYLNSAIKLSAAGTHLRDQLVRKQEVPPKEATLMCLLEIADRELLIELDSIDVDKLRDAISQQVRDGDIKYPFLYSRVLYDRAAELFPERRVQLSSDETQKLLDGVPNGVWQSEVFVTGPLGVLVSAEPRDIVPLTRIPLQHCSDAACWAIHRTALSTSFEASINRHLPKMSKATESSDRDRQVWSEFLGEIARHESLQFDDLALTGLVSAVGDAMSRDELESIVTELRVISAQVGDAIELLGAPDPDSWLTSRDFASLLQLTWLAKSSDVAASIEDLIASGVLAIPPGEVRRAQMLRTRFGAFDTAAEIGALGVRMRPDDSSVPLLRLRRLIAHLYDNGSETDRSEAMWQLRSVVGVTLEERMAEYLRESTPEEVITSLVLTRRNGFEIACRDLGIDPTTFGANLEHGFDDRRAVRTILWKLGFPPRVEETRDRFWTHHRKMLAIVPDASTGSLNNIEEVRATASNFNASLEGILHESLEFSWWALSNDHFLADRPFDYRIGDGESAWRELSEFQNAKRYEHKLRLGGNVTLHSLIRSFALLADYLEDMAAAPGGFERSDSELPKFSKSTELYVFPFMHNRPFVDLLDSSKNRIITGLRSVSKYLQEGQVDNSRNDLSHYSRTTPDIQSVHGALVAARNGVELLESLGLSRMRYGLQTQQADAWGRRTYIMRSVDGSELRFYRPSRFGWAGMPPLGVPQLIVRSAVFADPNEMLRFAQSDSSTYSERWSRYPLRRRSAALSRVAERETAADVARSAHGVLPAIH